MSIPETATFNHFSIKKDRRRFFYSFDSPLRLKCREEITLYNCGNPIKNLYYDLKEFKLELKIFTSYNKNLEFHGSYDDGDNEKFENLIIIEFPRNEPFETDEYKTIVLEYIIEISDLTGNFGMLSIPLDTAENTYIEIQTQRLYETYLDFFLHLPDDSIVGIDDNDNVEFLNNRALNYGEKLKFKFDDNLKNVKLIASFSHDLLEFHRHWFELGGAFGWISAVMIMFLLINHSLFFGIQVTSEYFSKYIALIIPISIAVCVSLIAIRGWIFGKDMEWLMYDIDNLNGHYVTFNRLYVALITMIISEIIVVVFILVKC